MSLHNAIKEFLQRSEEKEQINKLKAPVKPSEKQTKAKTKRQINWNAIEQNIRKYESLSQAQKKEADKTWGRTIPFWKRALHHHNKGQKDVDAVKLAKTGATK
jgi:hypothetical protein